MPKPTKVALLRSVLGEALRRARLEQGRTLADVATAARISLPYLSEVERGRKEVSSEVLAALCDALGIDLADLLVAVVFQLTHESTVGEIASLAIGRRMSVEPFAPTQTPAQTPAHAPTHLPAHAPAHAPTPAPLPRRRGDAYALAA